MQPRDVLRYDLLKIPMVRRFLRSKLWPEDINFGFTVYAFAFLVGLLFIGPQDRAHNFGLNLFWCFWWPASFFAYPFLGRVWCAVCPFMIYGELVQRWRMSQGAQLLKWPREQMDKWGPWFLFSLFFGILVWEEVWDLSNTAALSSWLLLIITAGAMIGSWHFERRIWCRYLCPIGGMNGLFAKLSMTELRARQGVCSSTCKTYHCFKGGPEEPPEGLETLGCPVYSHPAQLVDNRNCVLCMECLKACPHRSIEFRLRLPGVDLWTTHKPLAAEVCLMFMLLGTVYLHDCDDVLLQLGLNPELFLDSKLPHILLSSAFLTIPVCYSLHTTCPCGTASTTRSWRRCAVYIEVSSCQWAVI
jgi:polyferredoxin